MVVAGALSCGIGGVISEKTAIRKHLVTTQLPIQKVVVRNRYDIYNRRLRFNNVIRGCGLISDQEALDYDLGASNLEERLGETRDRLVNGSVDEQIESVGTSKDVKRSLSVQTELVLLALPAIAGQAIEPLAQLMETAYIGRLGALELASAGVSISIFNIVSKVFNIPLLSVATSFVAEDIAKHAKSDSDTEERRQLPSVSTALVLSVGIGIIEATALYFGAGTFLNLMGISSASSMRVPAQRFLQLRALGAPAVVLSLAIQGVFRGFKDTRRLYFV